MTRLSIKAILVGFCAAALLLIASAQEARAHPFFYGPFIYRPFFHGWYGPPWWPYPPIYYRPYYDYTGSARLKVSPRNAEVYIDGYFVGRVDDFDGVFQRLHVEPGGHELQIHLDGFEPYREKVLFRRGATVTIEHALQPLPEGAPQPPRPTPGPGGAARRPGETRRYGGPEPRTGFGTVSIQVQPPDAVVLVDGQEWSVPAAGWLDIQLPAGWHRIEVRREGYGPYLRELQVRPGRTLRLNISLTRGS